MKLIDVDAFVKSINESIAEAHKWGSNAQTDEIRIRAEQAIATFCEASLRARQMPEIDAVPVVHGKWIPVTNGRGGSECNMCHAYAPSYQSGTEYNSPYCPNCGAKMDGGAENE